MENNILKEVFDETFEIGNRTSKVLNTLTLIIEERKKGLSDEDKIKADIEIDKLNNAKFEFQEKLSKLQNLGK